MTLSQKQRLYATWLIPKLVARIRRSGFRVTFGDAYRDPRVTYGHPQSNHRKRLALDLNLFSPEGRYLRSTKAHEPFGIYWESLSGSYDLKTGRRVPQGTHGSLDVQCCWGGRFSDGNHYSLLHGAVR